MSSNLGKLPQYFNSLLVAETAFYYVAMAGLKLYVEKAGFQVRDPPVFVLCMLGIKAHATIPGPLPQPAICLSIYLSIYLSIHPSLYYILLAVLELCL